MRLSFVGVESRCLSLRYNCMFLFWFHRSGQIIYIHTYIFCWICLFLCLPACLLACLPACLLLLLLLSHDLQNTQGEKNSVDFIGSPHRRPNFIVLPSPSASFRLSLCLWTACRSNQPVVAFLTKLPLPLLLQVCIWNLFLFLFVLSFPQLNLFLFSTLREIDLRR